MPWSILSVILLITGSVVCTGIRQQQSSINVQWISPNSMEIAWDDSSTELVLLKPNQVIPGIRVPCLFSGDFGSKSRGDTLAVVGCMEDSETMVNIGVKGGPVRELLLKDGITFEDVAVVPREKRDTSDDYDDFFDYYDDIEGSGVKDYIDHEDEYLQHHEGLSLDTNDCKHTSIGFF